MAGKRNIFANILSKPNAQANEAEEVVSEEAASEEPAAGESGEAPVAADEGSAPADADTAADEEAAPVEDGSAAQDLPVADDDDDLDEVAKLKCECERKDARIAALERQVASLEESIAKWSANLNVVKQGYEALEQKLATTRSERDHLDGVRLSLERANARLVEQNNLLRSGLGEDEHEEGETEVDDVTATVKYEVLYTPPDPEMHESLEGSDFFTEGGEVKPPEFRMPGSGLFRRGRQG